MFTYNYTKYINHDEIATQIKLSPLSDAAYIHSTNDLVEIGFEIELTSSEETILNNIIDDHVYTSPDPGGEIEPEEPSSSDCMILSRWVHWDNNSYWRNKTSYKEATSNTFTPSKSGLYTYTCSFSYSCDRANNGAMIDLYYAYAGSNYNNIEEWEDLRDHGAPVSRDQIYLTAGVEYFFSMEFRAVKRYNAISVRNIMFELILYQE